MRNKRLFAIGIALVMVLTSFGMAFAQTPQTVTLSLKAQNGSGQDGTATLTDIGGGKTRVVIDVKPGAAGQPAHIHDGSCGTADLKGVKYPLTSITDGKSTTEVSATLASLLAAPTAINIHKSAAEVSVYTSCSNITAAAAPSALPASGAGGAAESQNGIFGIVALASACLLVMGATVVVLRRRAAK